MSTLTGAGRITLRPGRLRLPLSLLVRVGLVLALVGLGAYVVVELRRPDPVTAATAFPHDPALEEATGVVFSRVAVVGDGGLVMVEYVVQDVERATAFQADRAHVPTLAVPGRDGRIDRVSIMKPGHLIRAGQTYYFVYQNTGSLLQPGERASLTYRSHTLADVPVL